MFRKGKSLTSPLCAFTLVELLVVIVIIGILISLAIPSIGALTDRSKKQACLAELQELKMALTLYEQEYRDYPPTDLVHLGISRHNQINSGIESMVACLSGTSFANGQAFFAFRENKLENGDQDVSLITLSKVTKSSFAGNQLWEMLDPWGSPYIYFHGVDVHEKMRVTYMLLDEKKSLGPVISRSKTGQIIGNTQFQIYSCGSDAIPQNEDDVLSN